MSNYKTIGLDYVSFSLKNVGEEARNLKAKLDTELDYFKLKKPKINKVKKNKDISFVIESVPGLKWGDYEFNLIFSFSDSQELQYYEQEIICNRSNDISLTEIKELHT